MQAVGDPFRNRFSDLGLDSAPIGFDTCFIHDFVEDSTVRDMPVNGPVVIDLNPKNGPHSLHIHLRIEFMRIHQRSINVEQDQVHREREVGNFTTIGRREPTRMDRSCPLACPVSAPACELTGVNAVASAIAGVQAQELSFCDVAKTRAFIRFDMLL